MRRVTPVLGGDVSAVGGVVRDAMAGRPHGPELDLVVEGDAVAEAARVGRALGARVTSHPRFGTAHIELPHGGHVDFVSARTETYSAPGALPDSGPVWYPDSDGGSGRTSAPSGSGAPTSAQSG